MKTKYFFLLFTLLAIIQVNQAQITISGYIVDEKSNERLIGAHVWDQINKVGTISNGYGFFSIRIDKGSKEINLRTTYIGFEPNLLSLNIKNDTLIYIKLKSDNLIQEVKVSASNELPIELRNEISTLSISQKDIKMLPTLGGERDIIKAYQLMPGVQSGTEGSSGLYVRGGSPDQNLILLDDVPLYYVNHLGGFTSVFNDDAINSSKLIKGGFPAQYGSRLSAVMDVKMKEGNSKYHTGAFTIGLLSTKAMIEGPIEKDTSSYLISVRRFMYDLISRPFSRIISGNFSTGYTFWDANIKLNRIMSPKDRVYLSAYFGDDKVVFKSFDDRLKSNFETNYNENWGNILVSARWNHLFSPKIFSNLSASYTRYRYLNSVNAEHSDESNTLSSQRELFSGIQDISLRPILEYTPNNAINLTLGGEGTYHLFKPGVISNFSATNNQVTLDTTYSNKTNAVSAALYTEAKLKTQVGINFNIGFRYANYLVQNNSYASYEPRLMMSYLINRVQLKASYAKMQQHTHVLHGSSITIPVEYWVPATPLAPPSISEQYTFGAATTIQNKYEFSLETYYKKMNNLITFKEGVSYFNAETSWEEKIETNGLGTSYGVELLLQKKFGKITGWVGYTWSNNTRQFDNINQGKAYPYKFDRRHDFSIVINNRISDKIDFSVTWVFGSGQAISIPSNKYYQPNLDIDNLDLATAYTEATTSGEIYIYPEKNSYRANPYHRMDIGVNFKKKKPMGLRTWNLSIYNLYNRNNPFYHSISSDYRNNVIIKQKSMFPFMPSVSYSFNFW